MKASHVFGRMVSPPRLNASKKLRSSRRYFPSSLAAAVDSEPDFPMSEEDGSTGEGDVDVDCEELVVQRAINVALRDIWSGRHHDNYDTDDEDEDRRGGEGQDAEGAAEGEDAELNDWDDDENENALSALDMLGEDFERKSVANGEQM